MSPAETPTKLMAHTPREVLLQTSSSQPGLASVPRGRVAISEDVFGFYNQAGGPRTWLTPREAKDGHHDTSVRPQASAAPQLRTTPQEDHTLISTCAAGKFAEIHVFFFKVYINT